MPILGYLICLNNLNIYIFFHHDILCKVSSDSFIIALKSHLLYLRDLSLNFYRTLQYSRANRFPGNGDVRRSIKLVNSLIVNFGFIGMMQYFS